MSLKLWLTLAVILIPVWATLAGEISPPDTTRPADTARHAEKLLDEAERLSCNAHYNRSIERARQARELLATFAVGSQDQEYAAARLRCSLLLGTNYRFKSDVAKAKQCLAEGLDSCIMWLGPETPLAAAFCEELGQLYLTIGDTKALRSYAQQALALRRKLLKGGQPEVAESLDSVGWSEFMMGDLESSYPHLLEALKIRQALKPQQKLALAKSYFSLYTFFYENSRYDEMKYYAQRIIPTAIQAVGKDHPLVAEGYIAVGNCWFYDGDYDQAAVCYRKAHAILVRLFGPSHYRTIATLTNLGHCATKKGDYNLAVDYHRKAQKIVLQLYGENIWFGCGCTYLGQVYQLQRKYPEALYWYTRSLEVELKLDVPIPGQLRFQYNELARISLALGQPDQALEYLRKCLLTFQPPPLLDPALSLEQGHWPVDANFVIALCEQAEALRFPGRDGLPPLEKLVRALDLYRIGVAVVDKMRLTLQTESASTQTLINNLMAEVYDGAVRGAMDLYVRSSRTCFQELAFEFVQKGKAATLARSFQETKAITQHNIPADLMQKESELNRRLGEARVALALHEQQDLEFTSAAYRDLQSAFFAAQDKYRAFMSKLEASYPEYHRSKYQSPVVPLPTLQALLDDETALLEYYLADSTLYLFTVTRRTFTASLCGSSARLSEQLDTFRAALKSGSRPNALKLGRDLYQQLITPAWPAIGQKKNLVICPHEKLFGIPFEALVADAEQQNKPDYLLQQFSISYHYSATIFANMNSLPDRRPAAGAAELIAFAPFAAKGQYSIRDSSFFQKNVAGSVHHFSWITRDGKSFCELPCSGKEVTSIAAAFAAHKLGSTPYTGPEATKVNFQKIVPSARFVHLATHSFFNEAAPMLSGIVFNSLAAPKNEKSSDEILYSEEVYNLRLNAELVVLSSCESGIGKLVEGEGMIAMTRGFLYAGAQNVMVSLWKVEDQYTSELMIEFYRQVLGGESFKKALRSAKLKLMKEGEGGSPAMWGAFILYGQ